MVAMVMEVLVVVVVIVIGRGDMKMGQWAGWGRIVARL